MAVNNPGFKTLLFVFFCAGLLSGLDVQFKIRETTGHPADITPVTFVMPLPAWTYGDITPFRITDAAGATVPAQISVLNRHWQAGYVRHALVTLETPLSANEQKLFHFMDNGGNTAPSMPVSVLETASDVTVTTGPLQFKVKKQHFNLFDEAYVDLNGNGLFETGERIISSSADNGGVLTDRYGGLQKSSDVADPVVTVEESGPIRAIIRVEAPTIFTDTAHLTGGFVCRIYAWAGKADVKVEYTLKNSAFNAKYSWPLYCRDFSLKTRLNLDAPTVTVGKDAGSPFSGALGNRGVFVYQKQHNQFEIRGNGSVIPKTLELRPAGASMLPGTQCLFTGAVLNQYGEPFTTRHIWSVSGGGTIDSNGLFTSNGTPGDFIVRDSLAGYPSMNASASIHVGDTIQGLKVEYHPVIRSQNPTYVDSLEHWTPAFTGTASNFDYSRIPITNIDYFGVRFTGYIRIPAAGTYTFFSRSNEFCKMVIDDSTVIHSDMMTGTGYLHTGAITLSQGYHPIQLMYVHYLYYGNKPALSIKWGLSSSDSLPIPDSLFTPIPAIPAPFTPPVVVPYVANPDTVNGVASLLGSGVRSPGWMDVSDAAKGVTVTGRYFWEMWPNGLEIDTGNVLYVRMLPKWDAGYYWYNEWTRGSFIKSTTGLHWLDDMQHLTKEYLYSFHAGAVDAAHAAVAAGQFQKNPVGVVPTSWWSQTRVTADMGGVIPLTEPAPSPVSTNPEYMTGGTASAFNWCNFQAGIISGGGPMASCATGGIPFASHRFLATENPQYYYQDRAYSLGELNNRPQQMGSEADFNNTDIFQFTTMPYSPEPNCNYSWRPGWSGYGPTAFKITAPYLPGSGPHGWTSRDFEHMWFYHVEDFYYYDGMPSIRDWYQWLGQFAKVLPYDRGDNRMWRVATRGHGHLLSVMMGAYKMLGDSSFLDAATVHMYKLRAQQNPGNGQVTPLSDGNGEGGLHVAYVARALIRYMEEQKNKSCRDYVEAFGLLEGLIQWNYNWGRYPYYTQPGVRGTGFSGTAMVLADPEIWLYLHTGYTPYKTQTRAYADAKIYGDLLKWNLSSTNFPVFIGRLTQYAFENPRSDTVPPPAVADLTVRALPPTGNDTLYVRADSLPLNTTVYFAVRSFDSTENMSALSNIASVNTGSSGAWTLSWSPAPSAAYYHVRWALKPIVENDSIMNDTLNHSYFWAAHAVGNDINEPELIGAERRGHALAGAPMLECFPNPFNPATVVSFSSGSGGMAVLALYDVRGRQVRTLFSGNAAPGLNRVTFNAAGLASGVYVARLVAGNKVLERKITLVH